MTPNAEAPEVFVCAGPRTPFTRIDGALAHLDAVDISVPVVQAAVRDGGSEGGILPDLMTWGTVIPSLAVANIAREVWLDAGLEPHVPAVTIVQQCATSLAGATHAAGQARIGRLDLALCGGSETMSMIQAGLTKGLSQTLRRVEIMEGHWVKYQVGRYRSGLHLATEDEQHALSLLRPVEA